MKDFPGYNNGRGKGGPRTKKQLRKVRERALRAAQEQQKLAYKAMLLEEQRREPTLHDIDWKP